MQLNSGQTLSHALRQQSSTEALSSAIDRIVEGKVPILRLRHQGLEAGISLFGGQLLWCTLPDQGDLFWLSRKAKFDQRTPIRGGVPICWPWFGKAATPSHGFARTSTWQLAHHEITDAGLIVELTLSDDHDTMRLWPHRFHNRLRFSFGQHVDISLTITNTDDTPWPFSGALHSYLLVDNIDDTRVRNLGPQYRDSLDQQRLQPSDGTLSFHGEVDRIYTAATNPVQIDDPGHGRRLLVSNAGNTDVVVWNPGYALATQMADMDEQGYRTMVCIESAICTEAVRLAPGETHTLNTRLATQSSN